MLLRTRAERVVRKADLSKLERRSATQTQTLNTMGVLEPPSLGSLFRSSTRGEPSPVDFAPYAYPEAYTCISIYIHIHTHIHTPLHIYMSPYTFMRMCTHILYIYLYVHIYIYENMHMSIIRNMYTCTHLTIRIYYYQGCCTKSTVRLHM